MGSRSLTRFSFLTFGDRHFTGAIAGAPHDALYEQPTIRPEAAQTRTDCWWHGRFSPEIGSSSTQFSPSDTRGAVLGWREYGPLDEAWW